MQTQKQTTHGGSFGPSRVSLPFLPSCTTDNERLIPRGLFLHTCVDAVQNHPLLRSTHCILHTDPTNRKNTHVSSLVPLSSFTSTNPPPYYRPCIVFSVICPALWPDSTRNVGGWDRQDNQPETGGGVGADASYGTDSVITSLPSAVEAESARFERWASAPSSSPPPRPP